MQVDEQKERLTARVGLYNDEARLIRQISEETDSGEGLVIEFILSEALKDKRIVDYVKALLKEL